MTMNPNNLPSSNFPATEALEKLLIKNHRHHATPNDEKPFTQRASSNRNSLKEIGSCSMPPTIVNCNDHRPIKGHQEGHRNDTTTLYNTDIMTMLATQFSSKSRFHGLVRCKSFERELDSLLEDCDHLVLFDLKAGQSGSPDKNQNHGVAVNSSDSERNPSMIEIS